MRVVLSMSAGKTCDIHTWGAALIWQRSLLHVLLFFFQCYNLVLRMLMFFTHASMHAAKQAKQSRAKESKAKQSNAKQSREGRNSFSLSLFLCVSLSLSLSRTDVNVS